MTRTPGQIGYDRYLRSGPNPGKTFDGRPMPTWAELGDTPAGLVTRQRWEDSAQEIKDSGMILIEDHDENGSAWGISFAGSDPDPAHFIRCDSKEHALTLRDVIAGRE